MINGKLIYLDALVAGLELGEGEFSAVPAYNPNMKNSYYRPSFRQFFKNDYSFGLTC
jgi:hypothetical protein